MFVLVDEVFRDALYGAIAFVTETNSSRDVTHGRGRTRPGQSCPRSGTSHLRRETQGFDDGMVSHNSDIFNRLLRRLL